MRLPITVVLAAAAAAATVAPVAANAATDTDLARCRGMPDAGPRLACYDRLPLAAALPATATATAANKPAPAAAALPPAAGFGFEQRVAEAGPQRIDSRVPGLFEGWGPRSRIRLENGQVWQVVDDSRAVIDRRDPKVSIVRGLLGSFIFEVEGRRQTARVKRVE